MAARSPLLYNQEFSSNEPGIQTFYGKITLSNSAVSSATACGKNLTYISDGVGLYTVTLPTRYKALAYVNCALVGTDSTEQAWVVSYDLDGDIASDGVGAGQTQVRFGVGDTRGTEADVGTNELFFTIVVKTANL